MKRTLVIEPVTRIEGHSKVIIDLNDDDSVAEAMLVVNELKGFERFLIGMEAERMPQVTGRVCGVCPSAHHLAAVKALENGLGIEPPTTAKVMRNLFYMGHLIHSHAAHIYALSGPDLVFGIDGDPKTRNIMAMVEQFPEVTKKALRLRTLGQKINEKLGGRGVHPVCAVIGGMSWQLAESDRAELRKLADEALILVKELAGPTKDFLLRQIERHPALKDNLIQSPLFMGTVNKDALDFYDGMLRVIDSQGNKVVDFAVQDYEKFLTERPVSWSYMKPVYFKHNGAEHKYMVSTLARLNVISDIDTPIARAEFHEFRRQFGSPCRLTIMLIYARLIELIHCCEKAVELCSNPALVGPSRTGVTMKAFRGIGHVEAPRGTLIHDYEVDEKGIVRAANLIVATQHNYVALNESIKQSVEAFIPGKNDEIMLNAAEFAIRCYDPCLSCATHAWGKMPLVLEFRKDGRTVSQLRR